MGIKHYSKEEIRGTRDVMFENSVLNADFSFSIVQMEILLTWKIPGSL